MPPRIGCNLIQLARDVGICKGIPQWRERRSDDAFEEGFRDAIMLISVCVQLIPIIFEGCKVFEHVSAFLKLSHKGTEVVGKDKMIVRLVNRLEV